MSLYKNLFKQTAIYGIATVVPRIFSFSLTPLYTDVLPEKEYGEQALIFAGMAFLNVILAYGMETAFFRFYSSDAKKNVISTSTISLFWSSIAFLGIALLGRKYLAEAGDLDVEYVTYTIWILVLDALVIVPFSKLRAEGRPLLYAAIKIGNVAVNLLFNVFFLVYLEGIAKSHPESFWSTIYVDDFQVGYIFVSNLIASMLTLVVLIPHYVKTEWHFDVSLWRKMMRYSLPVMIAGLAFVINETFDRFFLKAFLPLSEDNIKIQIGIYSACYKLAVFMTLFTTAFRLGIEPFFFSHAQHENARNTYATITKYFVIFGSLILLCVVVFADVLKMLMLRDKSYWEGMDVVPLIILANFFLGIYSNLSVWYKLSDKTKVGANISIAGAIVTIVLNYFLIPHMGYMGSAIATISAYGTMMLLSFYFGNKYYPIPYDMKKISLYLGMSITLSAISFYVPVLRETYIFGILSIIALMAIIYKGEKETLQRILNRK
ncbi:MAG: polysaccharide biosynthesis protein [Flavobacterium psychrophilum]|nr:MAG: polysaccharide biosynthesis protein [Flavobacterium psychrophilum]